MVERQLRRRGIADERVLEAMAEVPRERFVSERLGRRAYADSALPDRRRARRSPSPGSWRRSARRWSSTATSSVLEIGTGSGYSAAVLARLAERVISIERFAELAEQARRTLDELGTRTSSTDRRRQRGAPDGRRSRRSRSTRPRRRRRRPCSGSSAAAAGS